MDVAIVGAGLMGTATAYPLSDNGHSVRLVGTHLDVDIIKTCKEDYFHPRLKRKLPQSVRAYYLEEIAEALEGVEIIVSGVNSLGAHWIGRVLSPYLHPGQLIIAITKGLEVNEEGNLVILPDVLLSELAPSVRSHIKIAAVGGPCIAGELAGRRQSCVVFGSREPEPLNKLADAFRTSYYHIWKTTDLVGLEFSAALKNAYALGVGLAAGVLEKDGGIDAAGAWMHNLSAAIFAQSCTEIDRILEIVRADSSFAYGLPGAGDLYVTSTGGRTIRLGHLLGAGYSFPEARQVLVGETLEAVEILRSMSVALPKLERAGLLRLDELPLMNCLIQIVVHNCPVDLPLDQFFGNGEFL